MGLINESNKKTYGVWYMMIHRCHNTKNNSYKYYGDRGISVCDKWRNSFKSFLDDIGIIPDGLLIDRIDNNGNYEPSNVRLVDRKTQNNNTRTNVFIEYDNKRQTIAQWAEELNINPHTIGLRLRNGLPVEKVLSTNLIHVRGEDCPSTKLTSEDVINIRDLYRSGEMDSVQIAKHYGIGTTTAASIIKGTSWGHLHGAVKKDLKKKLSDDDKYSIRRMFESGKYMQKEIAVMFNTTQSRISQIVNNKC